MCTVPENTLRSQIELCLCCLFRTGTPPCTSRRRRTRWTSRRRCWSTMPTRMPSRRTASRRCTSPRRRATPTWPRSSSNTRPTSTAEPRYSTSTLSPTADWRRIHIGDELELWELLWKKRALQYISNCWQSTRIFIAVEILKLIPPPKNKVRECFFSAGEVVLKCGGISQFRYVLSSAAGSFPKGHASLDNMPVCQFVMYSLLLNISCCDCRTA